MEILTTQHVLQALQDLGLHDIEMITFDESTATSQKAADQIGCKLGQIVKSLGFMVDGEPVLVLASGDGMVDDRKLATMHDVGRKKVKIAKPQQLVDIWGYVPGGMPPLGHRTNGFPVYIDTSLQRFETLYAAGGTHNTIFAIPRQTLVEKSRGQYADVRRDD